MFGGHVHSPSKSFFTPPLRVNVENPDHTSAPVESCHQDSIYEMKNKMFGGHVHSPSKSFFTPPLRVNVENPDHSSASAECRRQDSIYEMKRKTWGGMSTHLARASSLHLSESTWRIQITHQPQWRVAVKTLSMKRKGKRGGACPLT